ncbi:LOW QUALITY PROTEIN: hypothetical protein MAR_007579 [Mya arenaria]|uniref:Integrase catalytic domain-containing protein n=1 Tax=Mya arenaria TaxID=6604 RepID=A0ABY7DDV7_MYAAR|nr:LOW QUALITY PROTEIN: hypothetical protein MAR_007579 [Mya arenaria]
MQYWNRDYATVVDYFSKCVELRQINGKNAPTVERHLMAIFAVHGLPQHIVADNMPFNSEHSHSIKLTTTSPTYSQSNGQVERYVGIIKSLLRKAHENGQDESIALLEYRNTPITGCEYSPAQMFMINLTPEKMSCIEKTIAGNAVVHSRHPTPRSYIIDTDTGSGLRRNRRHLFDTRNQNNADRVTDAHIPGQGVENFGRPQHPRRQINKPARYME